MEKYQNRERPLFLQHCDSRDFGIFVVDDEWDDKMSAVVTGKDIEQKCLNLQIGNKRHAILPLINQD